MGNDDEIKRLLTEIRNNQLESLRRQERYIEIATQQLEHARARVSESIDLQKEAVARARTVIRFAMPALLVAVLLMIYVVSTYL